jgi:hypothetical protein
MITPVFSAWVAKTEAKGLSAKKGLTDLYRTVEQLGVKEPFVLPQ